MPLPEGPLTLHGGCSCRAIRYKIDIPPASQRPFNPSSENTIRLPYAVLCHCEDCRRATAGLFLSGFFTPAEMVKVSLLSRSSPMLSSSIYYTNQAVGDAQREWVPATEVFAPGIAPSDSFLTTYKSSEAVYRTFCGRCGTPLTVSLYPMPESWPTMLDIMLGSMDREDLKDEYMAPERQFFWNSGITWVKELINQGNTSIIKHPSFNPSETAD